MPHSLLLPGHGVPWPESHEFVLTKKYWHEHWKQEVAFDDEDPVATQQAIDEFLASPETQCEEHTSWTELTATVMTGIPSGETMEQRDTTPSMFNPPQVNNQEMTRQVSRAGHHPEQLKTDKAPGPDQMVTELYTWSDTENMKHILAILNMCG